MDNRIAISVELFGAERAEEYLEKINGYVNSLSGKKLKLAVDNTLEKMKKDLRAINNFKVQLRIDKNNGLAEYTKEINELTRKKHVVQMDITKAMKDLKHLNDFVIGEDSQKKALKSKIEEAKLRMREIQDEINSATDDKKAAAFGYDEQMRMAQEGASKLKMAMQEIKNMDITPRLNVQQMYTKIRNFGFRLGSAMQSIGNGLARITAPIDTLMQGTAYAAIFKGMNTVTEGLSGSFERYDIMHTYPKIMASMGESAKTSKKAIDDLYQSVLGLPTGLDTIVEAQKQYYLASGNMKKATKLAIAANNAFVGGGADDVQILQGQRQLRDLMSAGKLRISEWESLAKAMPGAFKAIQDDLHVTRADIMSGKVSADQFIDSLMKVGTGSGVVAQTAEQMKHTFTAVGANIRNALRNAGMETIETLDKTLKDYDGGDVIDHLLEIKPAINEIKDSVKSWINANPDKIIKFFERLKALDIKGFAKGIVEGFSTVGKVTLGIAEAISSIGGEGVGKTLVYMNLLAKFLRGFGGIVRGGAAPGAGAITGLVWLTNKLKNFFMTTNAASKLADVEKVQKIKSFFDRFKDVKKTAEATDAVASTATAVEKTAAETATIATSFKEVGANLLKAVTPAITAATYIGTIWLGVKAIGDIGDTNVNWKKVSDNLIGAGIAIAAMSGFMQGLSILGFLESNPASLVGSLVASFEAILSAGVFTIIAKLIAEINKTNIGDIYDLQYKLGEIMLLTSEMSAFMIGLGAVTIPTAGLQVLGELSALFTAGSFLAITKALDSIGRLKVPSTEKISEIADTFNALKDKLLKKGLWSGLKDAWKASDLKDTADDLAEATKSIVGILTNVGNASKQIESLGKQKIDKDVMKSAASNVQEMSGVFNDIFDAIQGFWGGNAKDTGGKRMGGATGAGVPSVDKIEEYSETVASINGAMRKLAELPKALASIKKAFGSLRKQYGDNHGGLDTEIITSEIQSMTDIVNAITGSTALGSLQAATDRMKNVNLDMINAQLTKIPTVMKTLASLKKSIGGQDWLKPTSETKTVTGNFLTGGLGGSGIATTKKTYGEGVTNMLDYINSMVDILTKIANKINSVPDMSENASKLNTAIKNVTSSIKSMNSLKSVVSSKGDKGSDINSVAQTVSSYISKLNIALANAPVLLVYSAMFKVAVNNVKAGLAAVTSGKGGSANAFVAALNKIPGAIARVSSAMAGKGAQWKNALVTGFSGTATKIKEQIDNIKTAVSNLNMYSYGYNAGNSFAQGYNAGLSNMNTPSTGNPIFDAVRNFFASTGGLITANGVQYRRRGGSIFKSRGTDTVPAMLTPGEFVMNKKATSKLGVGFLQRLNHLDIHGALANMYMRGGQLAYATPTFNIDKSTHVVNNNQQVHLTNNNASQGYQENRASRYMRKL